MDEGGEVPKEGPNNTDSNPTESFPASSSNDSASEISNKIDKEQLFDRLGFTLREYFDFNNSRVRGISGTIEDAGSLQDPMRELDDSAGEIDGRLRGVEIDSRTEDVRTMIVQARNIASEELVNANALYGPDKQVLLSLKKIDSLGNDWQRGEKIDDLMEKLREIDQYPDQEAREFGVGAIEGEILKVLREITIEADKMKNKTISFREESSNSTAMVSRRVGEVHDMLPGVRERLGDSYWNITQNTEQMLDAIRRYGGRVFHLESVPIEFKLIADEADRTGHSVVEILDLIKTSTAQTSTQA